MIVNDKLRVDTETLNDKQMITLKGTIDEDSNFIGILKSTGPVIFNFKEISSINSCGIRSWVNFIKDLGDQEIFYEQCPPLIVRQMNMVPSFMGTAKVMSVYVPFVCANCEVEKMILVNSDQFANPKGLIPNEKCESCKEGEMEFDGQPNQYFAFSK